MKQCRRCGNALKPTDVLINTCNRCFDDLPTHEHLAWIVANEPPMYDAAHIAQRLRDLYRGADLGGWIGDAARRELAYYEAIGVAPIMEREAM